MNVNANEADLRQFSITREIGMDCAHRVPDHKSKCNRLHGHRYVVKAKVTGLLHEGGEQRGMILDFGFLKELMMEKIHNPCDHGLIIYKGDEDLIYTLRLKDASVYQINEIHSSCLKLYWLDVVPTIENLCAHWFGILEPEVARLTNNRAFLECVIGFETPNSMAQFPS